jgi:hypothetical protein
MVISQSISVRVAVSTVAVTLFGPTHPEAALGFTSASPVADRADFGVVHASNYSAEMVSAWMQPEVKKRDSSRVAGFTDGDAAISADWLGDRLVSDHTPGAVSPAVDVTYMPQLRAGVVEGLTLIPAFHPVSVDDTCTPSDPYSNLLTRPALHHPDNLAGHYQVWVGKYPVIELPTEFRAAWVAQRLRYQLEEFSLDGAEVQLMRQGGVPTVSLNGQLILRVDDNLAAAYDRSADLLAIAWANNLRVALGQAPLELADAQTQLYGLAYTGEVMDGIASWYGPYFHGRITATGETFDQGELTAAHPSLPFGTYLEVVNLQNNQSVIVRINDRGPYWGDRSLDLSYQAAQCIQSDEPGIVDYEAHVLVRLPQPRSPEPLDSTLVAQVQDDVRDEPS